MSHICGIALHSTVTYQAFWAFSIRTVSGYREEEAWSCLALFMYRIVTSGGVSPKEQVSSARSQLLPQNLLLLLNSSTERTVI
jgi:hypothetical protein